jgi:hypothetical protein
MTEFDWLASFRKGDTNLAHAIGFFLKESRAPEDLRTAYEWALIKYTDGEIDDLAEAFGIQMTKKEKMPYRRT